MDRTVEQVTDLPAAHLDFGDRCFNAAGLCASKGKGAQQAKGVTLTGPTVAREGFAKVSVDLEETAQIRIKMTNAISLPSWDTNGM